MKNGGLKHKETYYVTVTAVNKVGLMTSAYSKPLTVDNTPPKVRLRDLKFHAQHCNRNTTLPKSDTFVFLRVAAEMYRRNRTIYCDKLTMKDTCLSGAPS